MSVAVVMLALLTGAGPAHAAVCFGPDTDGDGVCDSDEFVGDTDGDGLDDLFDPDDDGDGVPTRTEDLNLNYDLADDDTDGDMLPNYLDPDDDGDGIPTLYELAAVDTDVDGFPDYVDADDEGDLQLTRDEDVNGDGDPRNDDTDGSTVMAYFFASHGTFR